MLPSKLYKWFFFSKVVMSGFMDCTRCPDNCLNDTCQVQDGHCFYCKDGFNGRMCEEGEELFVSIMLIFTIHLHALSCIDIFESLCCTRTFYGGYTFSCVLFLRVSP